ncbi:MAG: hypothetical protein CL843_03210 [Crocinitomicaceae bacterium]|nr:hypothetical protein [Crocinitomicaceae bacterium]
MVSKRNIKNISFAALFSVLLVLVLFNTIEKPFENQVIYLQVKAPSTATLEIFETNDQHRETLLLPTQIPSENHVVAIEPQKAQEFHFNLSDVQKGDTLYFKSLMYLRGNTIRLIQTIGELEHATVENGTIDFDKSAVIVSGNQVRLSFSADNITESIASHIISRLLIYALIALLTFLFLWWAIPSMAGLSWLKTIGYFLFALMIGFGLYHLMDNLSEFPNRTVVDIEWDQKPGNIYGILPTRTSSFSDARPIFLNPNDPAAIPTLLISRMDPLHSLRIDVDPASDNYFITSVKVYNALAQLKATGTELTTAFPLVNDAQLKIVQKQNQSVLQIVPTGEDPYVIFYSKWLSYYRILDRVIFRINLYMGFLLVIVVFSLLIRLSHREKVLPVYQSWFPIVFLVLLFTPGLLWFFSSPTPYFSAEKRRTNHLKGIDTLSVSEIPGHIESYISDHFGARSIMISTDNIISVVLFNETNELSTVVIGKDDWMFYTGEGVKTIVRNAHPIDTAALEIIRRNLLERQYWAESHGSKIFFAFPPMKPTVYSEFLPDDLQPVNHPSVMETVINYLKATTDLRLINLQPTIMSAKAAEDRSLYYRRDSHWNHLGAFYAYEALVDTLNNYFPEMGEPYPLSEFDQVSSENNYGDLSSLLGLQDYLLRSEILLFPKTPCDCSEEFKRESPDIPTKSLTVSRINQAPINDLSIFIFRDSYSNYLITPLNPHFEESVYLWTYGFFPEAFSQGYPDIILYEVMERFVLDLAIPNPPQVQQYYQSHLDSIAAEKHLPQ